MPQYQWEKYYRLWHEIHLPCSCPMCNPSPLQAPYYCASLAELCPDCYREVTQSKKSGNTLTPG